MKNIIIKSCLTTVVFLQFQTKLEAQATNKIDSVGNVGIGTTSPTDKLTVEGQIKSGAILMTGWSQSPYSNSTWLRGANGVGVFLTNENVSRWAGLQADGSFDVSSGKFFVNTSTGFSGFNSKTPTQQLFVNGGSKTNSLYVGSGSNFSDRSGNGDNIYIRQPLQTSGGWWGINMDIQGPLSSHSAPFYPIMYNTDENSDGIAETVRFKIDKSGGGYFGGKVGIGINSPTHQLSVAEGVKTNSLYVGAVSSFSNRSGNGDNIYIRQPLQTSGGWWGINMDIQGPLSSHSAPFYPIMYNTDENSDGIAETVRFKIDKSGGGYFGGNIGIGTATPADKIHIAGEDVGVSVAGNARSRLNLYTGNQNGWQIEIADADGNQYAGDLGFTESGVTGGRLVLKKGGNVGIGLLNPSEKLSVNGNVRAKKVIVSQTGWPDYVFDSSYSLRTLSEVEKFITINKRLPDLPSAKEVEEKGISVGDNQALLLKKIEELTLYMIKMNNENKEMKKQLVIQAEEIKQLKNKQ